VTGVQTDMALGSSQMLCDAFAPGHIPLGCATKPL